MAAARWPLPLALRAGLLPLLWLLLSLAGLGGAPLFDVDEGAFSEATREMLSSGDWLHTTLNGTDRFDKPIGIYWLQALSVQSFGLHEWVLRLPSALSAWGWALALAAFARPRLGRQTGALVGWLLLTSLGVLLIGRAATADALLNLLLTLATLDTWRWLEQPFSATPNRSPLRRAYVWMGLGLLVKGPVAVLVPGAAALLWLATQRPWPAAWQRARQTFFDPLGWALLLAIAVPWYAYALQRHGMAFVEGFFIRHNLARYSGPLEQHGGSPFYYLVALPVLLWPWAPLMVLVLRRVRALWAEPLARFLLLWGGFVLGFFSLSGTKLPHYVLYGASPWLLLMARELLNAGPRLRLLLLAGAGWPLLLLCGLALALSQGGLDVPKLVRNADLAALLQGMQGLSLPSTWLPALLLGAGVWLWALLMASGRMPSRRAAALAAWAPVVGAISLSLLTLSLPLAWWGDVLQGPVMRAGLVARAQPGVAVQWGLHQPSFAVYRQQPAPRRPPEPGELALTQRSRLQNLPAADWQEIYSERGLVLLRWQGPAGAAK